MRRPLSLAAMTVIASMLGTMGAGSGMARSPEASTGPSRSALPSASTSAVPDWSPSPPLASEEVVRDTFDAPGDWWTGSDEVGTTTYADGGIRWVIHEDRRSVWDTQDLGRPLDRVRVEATVLVEEGSGGGGPMCGSDDPGQSALWAGVNGDGEWLVGRIVDTHVQVVDRGELPVVRRHDVPVGAPYPRLVTLECSIDAIGVGDGVTVWVDGTQVVDLLDDQVGPYATVGLTATGDREGFSVLFDDFAVYRAPGEDAGPSPGSSVTKP